MRLTGANFSDNQQSLIAARVTFLSEVGCDEMGFRERRMRPRKIGVIVRKLAMLVAARNARRSQYGFCSRPQLTIAPCYTSIVDAANNAGAVRYRLPSCALT